MKNITIVLILYKVTFRCGGENIIFENLFLSVTKPFWGTFSAIKLTWYLQFVLCELLSVIKLCQQYVLINASITLNLLQNIILSRSWQKHD